MNLIDRYIFKQVLGATIVGILIFIVVWISPEILFKIIKQTVAGHITVMTAFKMFFLEIPEILGKAIPVGLMLGSLFVFDRLSKDSELTIFRSIGVSIFKIAMPVFCLSLVATAFCYFTYEYLIPKSSMSMGSLKKEVDMGHFVYLNKSKTGKPLQILIIENYIGNNLNGIKLMNFSPVVSDSVPLMKNIITADSGKWEKDHLLLKHGLVYNIASNGVYDGVKQFNELNVLSPQVTDDAKKLLMYSNINVKELTVSQLDRYVKLLKSLDLNDDARFVINKLHQRFSQSFSCVLLALCGVILGFSKPREQKFLGFTIAVALIFLYYVIVPFLDMLAQLGVLNPVVSAWTPDALILIAIISLLKYKRL